MSIRLTNNQERQRSGLRILVSFPTEQEELLELLVMNPPFSWEGGRSNKNGDLCLKRGEFIRGTEKNWRREKER